MCERIGNVDMRSWAIKDWFGCSASGLSKKVDCGIIVLTVNLKDFFPVDEGSFTWRKSICVSRVMSRQWSLIHGILH